MQLDKLITQLEKTGAYTVVILFFVYYIFGDNEVITKGDVIKTVLGFAIFSGLINVAEFFYNWYQANQDDIRTEELNEE